MRGNDTKDDDENSDSKKRRYTEDGRAKARERYAREDRPEPSGFGRRPRGEDDYSDEDEDNNDDRRGRKSSRRSAGCKRFLQGVDRLPQRRPRSIN